MSIFAKLKAGVDTRTPEETQRLAAELAGRAGPEDIFALHGNLGVGKTTFVQGYARALGITQAITSPTFTVFHLYKAPDGRTLVHMDAYRLSGNQQMDTLMLEDFLTPPYTLFVEWPGNTGDWLPPTARHLKLEIIGPEHHRVTLL